MILNVMYHFIDFYYYLQCQKDHHCIIELMRKNIYFKKKKNGNSVTK